MRDWRKLPVNCTTRELIEYFNVNANSSQFMDYVTGTIMNNGLLFTGKETIEGALIAPLRKVDVSGVVNSNTIFDNFRMYFRGSDSIVELNDFPVDLTMYNDNKPHFLYFKEDRTYRVSDYVFGQADEVQICRFVINTNNTWQQIYITAQRAGTPMYYSGEEFYTLDGINVKSPGGLELSHTDGTVKRSGIEFTDLFSPDLYHDYSLSSQRCPLRYTDLNNCIDYNLDPVYNVDPDHYMSYDFNAKSKTNASERIRNIFNSIHGIDDYANDVADSLHHALIITDSQSDLREILQIFVDRMEDIYTIIGEFGSFLSSNEYFAKVSRTRLDRNITDYTAYASTYFDSKVTITEDTVQRVRDAAYYLVSGNSTVYSDSIDLIMKDMYDIINALPVTAGELKLVPEGKHTIQRVLWDIYEQCLILQYGDTVYDTLEDAVEDVGNTLYPVPFGHLLYIPLSALIIRQGCTDISTDIETVIVIKQYTYADSEQEGFADYVARALANKGLNYIYGILDGTYPAGKADSLKHTDLATGKIIEYDDGDFFLNYDNLRGRVTLVDNLNEKTYNDKKALSAHQGYVLDQNKLSRDGSQAMTGTLKAQSIIPTTNTTYNLGSNDARWNKIFAKDLDLSGNLTVGGNITNTNGAQYVVTGPTAKTAVRLEADSLTHIIAAWNGSQNGTVAVAG